ncbi:hypothetical protein [Streptomyces yangpuensis]|uniref:hypothetical protein n=1 Tax=Streptomyces yangpuensis TaxID=1648182 RepID=UPI0037184D0D
MTADTPFARLPQAVSFTTTGTVTGTGTGTGTEFPESADDRTGSQLSKGAHQLPHDARVAHCVGTDPPAGHDPHRYFIGVLTLDILATGIPADAAPAVLGFGAAGHPLGHAALIAPAETPARQRRSTPRRYHRHAPRRPSRLRPPR